MQFFSWWCPFQTKFLFFQTIESAKRAFAARADSGKPAFLHALFLENETQNSRKKYGAMLSRLVQGHMQNFSSFRGKKWPKSHLRYLCRRPFISSIQFPPSLGPVKWFQLLPDIHSSSVKCQAKVEQKLDEVFNGFDMT